MFGGNRRNNNKDNESLSKVLTPENPPKKGTGGSSVTGFDPEGLERAAKAARELDNSRNANQAIELIKTQEVTKQVCRRPRSKFCLESRNDWAYLLLLVFSIFAA